MGIDLALVTKGQQLLGQGQWAGAAEAFRAGCPDEEVAALGSNAQLLRNLAVNMADLVAYRPGVARGLETAVPDSRFSIEVTRSGRPTVRFAAPGRQAIRLIDGDDPVAYLSALMAKLKPARDAAQPLAVLGSGDGYLLVALARHPVLLPLGRQQCVHLIEPHAGNLLQCLMLHDMSGERGPIRQGRFQWFVGADCVEQFESAMKADLALPFPGLNVSTPPDGARLSEALQKVLDRFLEADRVRAGQIRARAAGVTLERLIDATSEAPSRRPRALLLTTRFSTVLRYSTQDTAEGLRQLGWETEVVMEPTDHSSLSFPMIREAMIRMDPDLILQLDHNRKEHGDLFPEAIPFVCWAQDHLPNLTHHSAGRGMGERDYLLTALGPWYQREFEYPAASVIPLAKLTRVPSRPEGSEAIEGADLVYVSNASARPEDAIEKFAGWFAPYPETQRLARASAEALIRRYAAGESVSGTVECGEHIRAVAKELGIERWEAGRELTAELFERINNLCYRQQALNWVADAADEMGLSLQIYGNGWEKHPRLARYARGAVGYGEELERLTRAARINLQIVPYFCLHQRLLDGIAAGGFFLVRAHPSDSELPALARFVQRHLPGDIGTLAEARRYLEEGGAGTEVLAELERLTEANGYIADRLDVIELYRIYEAQDHFPGGAEMPPRVSEVSFSSAAELRERLGRFADNAVLRREIAEEQFRAVADRLSYRAGMKRVIGALHERLKALRSDARYVA